MPAPILISFDSFEAATAARQELVAAGLPPAAVQLREMEDEAGPAEGNFVIGNGRRATGGPRADVQADGDFPYARNFEKTEDPGTHLLVVEAIDEAQRAKAVEILGRFRAVDVDAVRSRAGEN